MSLFYSMSCDLGSEVIVTVKDSLHVQLLLELLRPSCLVHSPPTTRFARALLIFLLGTDFKCASLHSVPAVDILHCKYLTSILFPLLPLPPLPSSGNDLFLEQEVRPYLSALLSVFCSLQEMDFTVPIPGLASFHEL